MYDDINVDPLLRIATEPPEVNTTIFFAALSKEARGGPAYRQLPILAGDVVVNLQLRAPGGLTSRIQKCIVCHEAWIHI